MREGGQDAAPVASPSAAVSPGAAAASSPGAGAGARAADEPLWAAAGAASPRVACGASQTEQLQALVRQSREEQSLINSKILALKDGISSGTWKGPELATLGEPSPELAVLRERLAEMDSLLIQRDADVERLEVQVTQLQSVLEKARQEPLQAGIWRQRYEDMEQQCLAQSKEMSEMKGKLQKRNVEIGNLGRYIRQMEAEIKIFESHRDRLLQETSKVREQLQTVEFERKSLMRRVRELEEGFARCVGRVSHSLAAGVATVILNGKTPELRFLVLRQAKGGNGVLELFQEPDADDEVVAMDLAMKTGCTAESATDSLTIVVKSGPSTLRMCCVNVEEFTKWTVGLEMLGFDGCWFRGALKSLPPAPPEPKASAALPAPPQKKA